MRALGPVRLSREAYGSGIAFLFGWAQFFIIQTGKIAAVAVAFASFAGVGRMQPELHHGLLEHERLVASGA